MKDLTDVVADRRKTADRRRSQSEVPFGSHEMFFSRTDGRGVIESGNAVFVRVTGYELSELVGAPHKLVRHPDMPKGLFQLLWNRLKAGQQTGFYVKNADRNGRYYWVFALVGPIDRGYMSVRIKPTSRYLSQIEEVYAKLLAAERKESLSPEASAARLEEEIKNLGFASFDSFQSAAISSEVESRSGLNGDALTSAQKRFMILSAAIAQVQIETTEMTHSFQAIRTVPLNMRIIASRLENAGGPISAISVNYSQMLEEMSTWVKTFVDGEDCVFALIRNAILRIQFLGFSVGLMAEMKAKLREEAQAHVDADAMAADLECLDVLARAFVAESKDALTKVEVEAMRLSRSVLDMKRYVTGLSSTRMMCKIESASLSNSGTALAGIVDQLDACQDEIEDRLSRIVEQNAIIQSNTVMLRTQL